MRRFNKDVVLAGCRRARLVTGRALDTGWHVAVPHFPLWCAGFVALGLLLRLARYLLRFPLWADECMLVANYLSRDFLDLLNPLEFNQVAPIGFMWLELALTRCLGFNEWALRLFPLLCGLASIGLFLRLLRQVVSDSALVLGLAIFCVSYYPVRLGAEAKPYSADLAAALVVNLLALGWWRTGRRSWLWGLAAVIFPLMLLSFPVVFVGAATLAVLPWTAYRDGRRDAASPLIATAALLSGGFLLLHWLTTSTNYAAVAKVLTPAWSAGFPPLNKPWQLPKWLLLAHAGELSAYPVGGESGASTATLLLSLLGGWMLCRQGRQRCVALLVAPLLPMFIAAALHRYPYGGHARLVQCLAPGICLMAGAGLAGVIGALVPDTWRGRGVTGALATCAMLGVGLLARDLVQPYKIRTDEQHRAFARWFWKERPHAQSVCVLSDWGLHAFTNSWDAIYLTQTRICRPVPFDGLEPEVLTGKKPLRCVLYHKAGMAVNQAVFQAWMRRMKRDYHLVGEEAYPVHASTDRHVDFYEVFWFVRRTATEPAEYPRGRAPQCLATTVRSGLEWRRSWLGERPGRGETGGADWPDVPDLEPPVSAPTLTAAD